VGAGNASYSEFASVDVLFEREPSPLARRGIAARLPAPLRETQQWEGVYLRVETGQWAHAAIAAAYAPETLKERTGDLRGFHVPASQVQRFNQELEAWLHATHLRCPITLAFRPQDKQTSSMDLSPWDTWSVRQVPKLQRLLEPVIRGPEGNAARMLRLVLLVARNELHEDDCEFTEAFTEWFRGPARALQQGDGSRLASLLEGYGPRVPSGFLRLLPRVDRTEEKQVRAFFEAASFIVEQDLPEVIALPLAMGATLAQADGRDDLLVRRVLDLGERKLGHYHSDFTPSKLLEACNAAFEFPEELAAFRKLEMERFARLMERHQPPPPRLLGLLTLELQSRNEAQRYALWAAAESLLQQPEWPRRLTEAVAVLAARVSLRGGASAELERAARILERVTEDARRIPPRSYAFAANLQSPEAVVIFERILGVPGLDPDAYVRALGAVAHEAPFNLARTRRILEATARVAPHLPAAYLRSAVLWERLGERDRALDSLRAGVAQGLEPQVILQEMALEPLTGDPRFQALAAAARG
jgi:hypothetical protein